MNPSVSIIIPTLNEEGSIEKTIQRAQLEDGVEIVVVDGGSSDNTINLARSLGCLVLQSDQGRATQMNSGVNAATADIILLLHGDTLLPKGYVQIIRKVLQQKDVIAGAFQLSINSDTISASLITWFANRRSHLLQLPYGDQGLFLIKESFIKAGGYPETPFMEDFELVRTLKQHGNIITHPSSVLTSARRWQRLGFWRTTFLNQVIVIGYLLGIPVDILAGWYRKGSFF